MESIHKGVLQVIKCHTAENPVTTETLIKKFNVDKRDLTEVIAQLRTRYHEPVLSSTHGGYYWPKSPDDAKKSFSHLVHRIQALNRAIKGLQKGLDREFGGQLTFNELINNLEMEVKNDV